ncbi:hypothetical protein [Pseudovibrio sp. Tun.PSC04-5.I4]|nr:hypothetical protein [Pseudovibrio sp. Tun.PSC04-5.I4]
MESLSYDQDFAAILLGNQFYSEGGRYHLHNTNADVAFIDVTILS